MTTGKADDHSCLSEQIEIVGPKNAKGVRAKKPKARRTNAAPRSRPAAELAAKSAAEGAETKEDAAGPCRLLGWALCRQLNNEKIDQKRTEFTKVDCLTGCWLAQWQIRKTDGYAQMKHHTMADIKACAPANPKRNTEKNFLLHKVGYAAEYGKDISASSSHLCHNRNCFRGSHIVDEPIGDNRKRNYCRGTIRCTHGHVVAEWCSHDKACANGRKCLSVTLVHCCHDVESQGFQASTPIAEEGAEVPVPYEIPDDFPGARGRGPKQYLALSHPLTSTAVSPTSALLSSSLERKRLCPTGASQRSTLHRFRQAARTTSTHTAILACLPRASRVWLQCPGRTISENKALFDCIQS